MDHKVINLNNFIKVDNSVVSNGVTAYFRNLKEHLLHHIHEADMVMGAVAWITDLDILEALSEKPTLLTIQKEDFLRPDLSSRLKPEDKRKLHAAYAKLKPFDGSVVSIGPFYQCTDDTYKNLPPILCFGYHKKNEMYRTPRLHNKFLVFLTLKNGLYYPTSVWTGSLNLTQLSIHSLENAILVTDNKIASAYAEEAQIIYLLGEPLNWSSSWINPFICKKI